MTQLLIRLFIRHPDNPQDPHTRAAYGNLASIVGMVCNVLLCLGKLAVGTLFGSIAIMADALNNLSDASSNIVSLVGFKLASRAPDAEHPFGHARYEYLAGLVVSVTVLGIGFSLLKESVVKVLHPTAVQFSLLTVAVLVASILVKVYMALYNTVYGKKIDSSAMKATATDSLSDCIATTVVSLSMLLYWITGINLDGWSGLVVAIFILLAGVSSAKDTLSPLLGEAPDMEFVHDIEETVKAHAMVAGVHDMVIHNYGPGRIMVSLHAEVPGNLDIYKIHDEIDLIERELKSKYHCEVVIHMDPIAVDNKKVMGLRKEVEALVKQMDEVLSIHDFRMVEGPTHTNLIFDVVVPQGYPKTDEEVSDEISGMIESKWKNYHAVIKMEKRYI